MSTDIQAKKIIRQRNHILLFEIYNMSENLKVFFSEIIRDKLEQMKTIINIELK